ncbi:MAG: hypothetical protein JOZ83_07005 [Silvibacterium sp.]|nr:hypothetical protein [Silvibacterium sp.]
MSPATIDLSFHHTWSAEILSARPLILLSRQYVYPKQAEEIERGALEVMIRPDGAQPFLATFALGFADTAALTGLWACPNPDWLCALAGGYAYLVNTRQPQQFEQIEYQPVLLVRALPSHGLLVFGGHHSLLGWGSGGKSWQTERLSAEGFEITQIVDERLEGIGWDLITDRDVPFAIDLRTGTRI